MLFAGGGGAGCGGTSSSSRSSYCPRPQRERDRRHTDMHKHRSASPVGAQPLHCTLSVPRQVCDCSCSWSCPQSLWRCARPCGSAPPSIWNNRAWSCTPDAQGEGWFKCVQSDKKASADGVRCPLRIMRGQRQRHTDAAAPLRLPAAVPRTHASMEDWGKFFDALVEYRLPGRRTRQDLRCTAHEARGVGVRAHPLSHWD